MVRFKLLSCQIYSYPFHWDLVISSLWGLHVNCLTLKAQISGISTRNAHFQRYGDKSTLFYEPQSLNLESLILESQILPVEFAFTHDNSFQVLDIS